MSLNMLDSTIDNYSCPPLTDADYLTSSRAVSRKASRKESRPPTMNSAGPAFGESTDYGEDKLGIDPRRFTPTLHANLVSEILSLRREVESKNSLVLNLEEQVVQVREENTKLQGIVSTNLKEKKSLKRHMDALESGTLAAIEDIARERDQANETLADTRSQLERLQKKARKQEEDVKRTNDIWQQDQEKWAAERRLLERKIHVVEGRLMTILSEVAATQANSQHRKSIDGQNTWARERPSSRASGRRSAGSHYRESLSISTSMGGRTLADELNLDTASDADSEYCGSPEALPEEADFPRSYSSQSNRQSIKARKLLGLHIDTAEDVGNNKDPLQTTQPAVSNIYSTTAPITTYSDIATQYSPPLSPVVTSDQQRLSTITEFDGDSMLDESRIRPLSLAFDRPPSTHMVSSSCQTIGVPLSPPETPNRSRSESCELQIPMVTSSTQTSENLFTATMGVRSDIPVIAIHAVQSDGDVVMPPNSRNASTQAHIVGQVASIAIQTENIRTDERLTKLPAHLHPAIIHPISPTPSPVSLVTPEAQEAKEAIRNVAPKTRPTLHIPTKQSVVAKSILRKSMDQTSHDQPDSEDDMSDDSFLKRAPIKKVLSKVDDSWQMVASPVENIENITDTEEIPPKLPDLEFGEFSLRAAEFQAGSPRNKLKGRPSHITNTTKDNPNDVKANISRTRSPSEPIKPERTSGIPFPVPDRSSSRKFPWLPDDFDDSPTRRPLKNSKGSRVSKKKPGIRKSRSEIGDQGLRTRSRSPSPQPFDIFTDSLANIPPPLPENDITAPGSATFRHPSQTHSVPSQAESTHSDQTTIVDAIAQTMIGEWMFKYVRRKKSFGLPDEPGTGENSVNGGIRHQRWVWVAPYERAVMWSSKQPTSGTALMGKSGRKLIISSVLDVVDDSPMPKGAPQTSHFGRSILILTPQRALKFTATSLERHYIWMNALSFLSQGAVDFADIIDRPPPVTASVDTEKSRQSSRTSHRPAQPSLDGSLHRSRINDSIRIAKGKERPYPAQRVSPIPAQLETQQTFLAPEVSHGAEAPSVPRTSADTRRRSNTASRGQAASIRSFTSSNKGSVQSLRSRGADAQPELPQRSVMRLWSGKPQRIVSESATGTTEPSRATSRNSAHPEGEPVNETVGTMRMSAFVQDVNGSNANSKRIPDWREMHGGMRSFSANDAEQHSIVDTKRSEGLNARGYDKSRKYYTYGNTATDKAMTRTVLASGSGDPFVGF